MLTSSNSVGGADVGRSGEPMSIDLVHRLFSRFVIYFMVVVICVGLIYILIWSIKHHIWDRLVNEEELKRQYFFTCNTFQHSLGRLSFKLTFSAEVFLKSQFFCWLCITDLFFSVIRFENCRLFNRWISYHSWRYFLFIALKNLLRRSAYGFFNFFACFKLFFFNFDKKKLFTTGL